MTKEEFKVLDESQDKEKIKEISNIYRESTFEKNLPITVSIIKNHPGETFMEKKFNYYNGNTEIPVCKNCSGEVPFRSPTQGYLTYCCKECEKESVSRIKKSYSPEENKAINAKRAATNLEKYGDEFASRTEKVKEVQLKTNLEKYGDKHAMCSLEKQEERKKTSNERYGVDYYAQTQECQDRIAKTNIEKIGVKTYFMLDDVKEKGIKAMKLKHGVDFPYQSELIREKTADIFEKKYGEGVRYGLQHKQTRELAIKNSTSKNSRENNALTRNKETIKKYQAKIGSDYEILEYNNFIFTVLNKKINQTFTIDFSNLKDRIKHNIEVCVITLPISSVKISNAELQIRDFLDKNNIEYRVNVRDIIKGELDIYIPQYNLAIEHNGLYYHDERNKEMFYHQNKSLLCQEKGIFLIHVFEDDWLYKSEIIKSMLLSRLGLIKNKINARDTEVKEVDTHTAMNFLEQNHILGKVGSHKKIGLYYNNELVSLMTFSKKKKEDTYVILNRFCSKINHIILGGSSKLFSYYINNNNPDKIISYSDFSMFDGRLYESLGFTKSKLSDPNYYWVINKRKYHKFNFSHKKLVQRGFDTKKSETQIMNEQGYYRIFGCGHYRWEYRKPID